MTKMLASRASRHQFRSVSVLTFMCRVGAARPLMRVCAAFLLVGTLTAGEANASSFVSPREIKGGLSRSMVVLGTPDKAGPKLASAPNEAGKVSFVPLAYPLPWSETRSAGGPVARVISASIIAMGQPAVTFEKVAAVAPEKKPKHRPAPLPVVIRGGIVGDAFSSPVPTSAAASRHEQQVVEAPTKSPAKPASPKAPSPQPAAPPPAPPPPPTPQLPQLRGVE